MLENIHNDIKYKNMNILNFSLDFRLSPVIYLILRSFGYLMIDLRFIYL